ncbi:MAG TPA: hypothetical protein VHP37_22590 [Burkholderiales bacterium]|nr:hypothetical protein [Burkholderiales bacterium]
MTVNGANEPVFEVVWPGSRRAASDIAQTAPLSDLNGKVIAEVWDRVFRGDQMFPHVRNIIKRRFPQVAFVDHDEFGDIFGWNEREVIARLPELLRKHRADAAIVGVGA